MSSGTPPLSPEVDERAFLAVDPEREALQVRLDVGCGAHRHLPAIGFHDIAGVHLAHPRSWPPPGRRPAAGFEDIDAALVRDARTDVWTEHALLREELLRHAGERRRTVHVQVGDEVGPHVPALENEPRILHAMVVVEVAQEDVGDVHRPGARLDESVVGSGPVVHDDAVVADLDEIAGACPLERRRGRSGAEQGELHRRTCSRRG